MKRYVWLALGSLLVGAFVYSWYRAMDNPYRKVIRLEDGSIVRMLQMTVGTTHKLGSERTSLIQRWLGGAPHRPGMQLWRVFDEPTVVVWLEQRAGRPVANPMLTNRRIDVCVVDSKGACLPAEVGFVGMAGVGEMVWAIVLPRLPKTERSVELRIRHPKAERTLRLSVPALPHPAPPAQTPQPLPARVETDEFVLIVERIAVEERRFQVAGTNHTAIWRGLKPYLRVVSKGKTGEPWRIAKFWFEDPYGNRYRPEMPPPWHYPYWVLCCELRGKRSLLERIPIAPLSEQEVRALWEQATPPWSLRLAP